MTYRKVPPPAPLADFIESFSYWEGDAPSPELMTVMATRTLSVQIDLHDDELRWYGDASGRECHRLRGVTIAGAQSRPFAIEAWQPRIVRVVFKPGGAFPLLRLPLSELRDSHVSLEDIWGKSVAQLQEQLSEAGTPDEIFELLAKRLMIALERNAKGRSEITASLARLNANPAGASVRDLARHVQLSPKRFIRFFSEEVGLTPKLYLRIARFERLLAGVYSAQHIDWSHAAVDHGYFDQSHLIRDFQEFAGMTPGMYFARRGPAAHAVAAR